MNIQTKGILLGLIACFFYALMDAFAKFGLEKLEIPYSIYYFYVNIIILCILTPYISYMLIKKQQNLLIFRSKFVLLVICFSMVSFSVAFIALPLIPLDIYYSILLTTPIVTAFLGITLLKEELTVKKIIALSLGLIGVLTITNPFNLINNNLNTIGILLAFIVVIFDVLIGITSRKFLQKEKALTVRYYLFLISSIWGAILLFKNPNPEYLIKDSDIYIVLGSSISMLLGSLCLLKSYQYAPASLVSSTYYSFIVWAIIFGYLVFGDIPTLLTILGCIIIICANIYLYKTKQSKISIESKPKDF